METRIKKNRGRKIKFLLLPFTFLLFTCLCFSQTLAPGAPGKDAQWASAGKQGVGTSATLESKVWFTLQGGALTEVYYPNVAVGNVHLLQFVVVNPKTKKVETERDDATHEIKVLRPDSLTFQQINTAKSGEWKITKTYATDVERDSVLIDVKFEPKNKNFNLYIYNDPSLGNSGMGDNAYSPFDSGISISGKKTLTNGLGSDDGKYASSLILCDTTLQRVCGLLYSSNLTEFVNGYYGVSDGLEQLKKFGKIQKSYLKAQNGNVAQLAKVTTPSRFTVVLSFVKDQDVQTAAKNGFESMKKGFSKVLAEYEKEWSDYVKTLRKVDKKYQAQFNMAAMVLKAHEDKIHRGANIASLSVPWGGGDNANEDNVGGYHLVWSRDLYQVFTAYMALGDKAAAERALDFLLKVQQKPDGSFPQNSWLDGKPFWGSLQHDEVAFPLIMAYQLGKTDKETYEKHLKKAADFIVRTGPSTPQERWEEEGGYSPSTIAAQIAGLVCVAEIAKKNGDMESATKYLKTADEWEANIEKWTATTTGKYGDGNYYLRITQNGKPDAGEKIELNNGAGVFDEREIVDAGFLELVRLGIKPADDPLIMKSVKVIDEVIKVKTPNGEAFYRYNNDGYGEMDDGRRWNWDGKYTGKGRLWVLLSGERGQYELAQYNLIESIIKKQRAAGIAQMSESENIRSIGMITSARKRLDSMQKFANNGLMIPEQVWDKKEVPKADSQFSPNLQFGEGTGSATPLAWSMAQFIRLAVNLKEGKNLDTPDVVYERYVLGGKSKSKIQTSISGPGISGLPINNRPISEILNLKPYRIAEDCSSNFANSQSDTSGIVVRRIVNEKENIIWRCGVGRYAALLFYYRDAKKVEVVGDFTNWKPANLVFEDYGSPFTKNLKHLPIEFPKNARVEYKLIVDGKWITDPWNPKKVSDGKGGENSVIEMPDYKPSENLADKSSAKNNNGCSCIAKEVYESLPEGTKFSDLLKMNKGSKSENGTTDDKEKFPFELRRQIANSKASPKIIGNKAYFYYTDKAKKVMLAGDFTGWKPKFEFEEVEKDFFAKEIKFPPNARVEYKLIVDDKWILDPMNAESIDNGVGGENSVLEMPDYKPSEWAKDIEKSPLFDTKPSELEVDSKKFGKRTVKIYIPSEYFKRGIAPKLPVMYLQDGSDYITRGKAINVLERLVSAKKVEPFMLVFIEPKDRMKEYWANDDWADFMANEVVPTVEKKYFTTIKTGRENRALLGASLGGITSFWIALKYPKTFANVGGQSSSFWVEDEKVVKELEKLKGDEKFKFYLDDGTFEGAEDTRRVNVMLSGKGFPVTYVEGETGHNWTSWRDRLADAFVALMK